MDIDIYAKSEELLSRLANSIYDRDPSPQQPFTFSLTEIQLVERWLTEFIDDIKKAR